MHIYARKLLLLVSRLNEAGEDPSANCAKDIFMQMSSVFNTVLPSELIARFILAVLFANEENYNVTIKI